MKHNITSFIYRFHHTDSILEKVNPVYKLLCLIILNSFILITFKIEYLLSILIFIFFLGLISRLPVKYILLSVKRFWLLYLIIYINMIFVDMNYVHIENAVQLGKYGYATIIVAKIIFLIIITNQFTFSTSIRDITYGLSTIFYPLQFLKLPVSDIVLIIMTAFRFIPVLHKELNYYFIALKSRDLIKSKLRVATKLKLAVGVLVPIIMKSIRRSEIMAYTFETRGIKYNRISNSMLIGLKPGYYDFLFLIVIALMIIITVLLPMLLQTSIL